MDWILIAIPIWLVLEAALCFNVDPVAWKSLRVEDAGFGQQMVQRESDLLVGAPLQQYSGNRRGRIFQCSKETCRPMNIYDGELAVNMSLGLTMTYDSMRQKTLVCGPTIPTECKHITLYNGKCIELDRSNRVTSRFPSKLPECTQADIAFLLDGSGSVDSRDFEKMKTFVINLISSLQGEDVKFAVTQFSTNHRTYFNFATYSPTNWWSAVNAIRQQGGGTNTATAILNVVQEVFSRSGRPNANKILIVITDGESYDTEKLPSAINRANSRNIVRYAIGVGRAFSSSSSRGKQELDQIASAPKQTHVFQVESFQALDNIRKALQSQIFPIEGSQTSGNTLKMEMSQEGFSAAYVAQGIQMGIVGANQWRGGYKRYDGGTTVSYESMSMAPDSYLGYSMTIATTSRRTLTILGAPRYQHRGAVEVVFADKIITLINPSQLQAGEYFGAVVCAMDVDSDQLTDLVLVSSPMYKEVDREGRVYVCTLTTFSMDCYFNLPSLQIILKGDAMIKGRFGSALTVLPDLNMDKLNDLAVGAPLENDGQGSIYIFHGGRDNGINSINPTYSQRIAASQVQAGLKFFGVSLSQWSFDQSGDNLPDLVVGSKGTVVYLRSRPIVTVEAFVTFSPKKISTQEENCSKDLKNTAAICFLMKTQTTGTARAKITYTFTLDATRKSPNNRAYFAEKRRQQTGSTEVNLGSNACSPIEFFTQACPEDALNPLKNELSFTFEGLPSSENLRPSLAHQAMTTFHPMEFEINCGADETCMDNLKVDFDFRGSPLVKVGIDEVLDVIVSLENREENSYNSYVTLTYPAGISYTKFTMIKGRIECNSTDSENGESRGTTICTVDKPILKSKSKANFIVSYGIGSNSQLGRKIFITANATSGNQQHSSFSELYKKKEIDVKYSILVTIEGSHSYTNFSFEKVEEKPFQQSTEVTNNFRPLNLTVVIEVPIKLGDKDIWGDSQSLQIPDCRSVNDKSPAITDFIPHVKANKTVDCSVATCRTFKCRRFMERQDKTTYTISANLSSAWIKQIGLSASRFILISTVSLEYDQDQYIFFSTTSNHNPPVRKIETEVEVYTAPNFTKEIVGGSLGGLAFVALVTAALYKAGFFKRKYNQMINENENVGDPVPDGEAPPEA
ncbi:integrin alpha-M [Oryzias melastigma]|uniref:Integrin alpha-M-like n=1 Tax=Oryzias melastigma TaxID=30732 RepID=A0A3B3CLE1_ORYME|nr:integrin alpha-M [Oryzias melastigma]